MSQHILSPLANQTLRQRCSRIELLVADADGVLTDGSIVYGELSGQVTLEVKGFHVRDGSALKLWARAGKRSAVITGRSSGLIQVRADELGVERVFQGAADKLAIFEHLLAELDVPADWVCYVGDDLPDVPPLRRCGLAAAVADACPEARAVAHYVTGARGGRGAVREVVERILRCQNAWPEETLMNVDAQNR
jgi:YrbI family 3-deoxy-D-manno-octulosonate 8-phosphate phosphatase